MKTRVCGVMVLVNGVFISSTVFILLSLLANIILTALIVSWHIYRRAHFWDLGAEHRSPYINVIAMCVESSALVVIFNGTYTALTFSQQQPSVYWALIPFQLLPHIHVGGLEHHNIWSTSNIFGITRLSPLLIVYRIIMGRAIAPTLRPSEQGKVQIRFNIPTTSQSVMIQTFPYSTTSTTRPHPQVSSDSLTKVLESEAGLVGSSLAGMSELGRLQLHPFQ